MMDPLWNDTAAMGTSEHHASVVIVGGGPVGTGLAIELGRRGISCILVERHHHPRPIPKGQNLTQRTLEHFHFWGAEAQLRAARTIPRDYGIGGMTSYGTLLGDYSHDWLQRELVRPFYFTDNERLPQYATEAVLRRRAGEIQAVEAMYGWTCTAIRQDADGVSVDIASRNGPARRLCRGLRRQPLDRARPERHHPDPLRSRPADGASGVSLERPAPPSCTLSRQILLLRAASRTWRLLEVLWTRRSGQHLVLPCAGPSGHDAR
jgi:glycine/D-amino acid oxidase-like deaminating enzyme